MNGEQRRHGALSAVVGASLRNRWAVLVIALALAGYGFYSLERARYDVFPEFAPPQVVIQAEAPGLAPEQVEVLVTQPIENALNGLPGIATLRSASIQGLANVTVVFETGSDIYRDRQLIAERLATVAAGLPRGVQTPAMTPLTSSTSTVLIAGLTSASRSLMELRTAAQWTLSPRLLAVPGVAKVVIYGGETKQLQVQVHPDRLIRFHLSLDDVVAAAGRATGVEGAGFVSTPNQRIVLRSEGQSLSPERIGRTVLAGADGASVRLASVADVVAAPAPAIGAAQVMGRPGVVLVIAGQYGANTLEVTGGHERALEDLRSTLDAQGITLTPDLFRPADFIQTSTRNVRFALMLGGILVVLVLFAFLFDVRTAAISFVAIPLALLGAVLIMAALGYTLNVMTLGGLAIAVGVVVDDAVIDVENMTRRLRENARRDEPRPAWRVVLDASIEVRGAILYATFAVILVFLPVLTLSGLAGRLFAPLGVAFILAVLASLVVALTVTPALVLVLIGRKRYERDEPPLVRWSKARYRALLSRVEARPTPVLAGVALLLAAGLAALPFFRASFIPELKETHFIVHVSAVPGTSLEQSLRIGRRLTRELLALPAVRSVSQHAGRAEEAEDIFGSHYSELNVDLKPLKGDEADVVAGQIRGILAGFTGVNSEVNTFLTERVEETISGYVAAVVVNVFGNDLDVLDRKAAEIARILGQIPHAVDVALQSPPGMPQLSVALREADVRRWGMTAVNVLDDVRTAYEGQVVAQVYDGNRVFDVSVILAPASRRSITEVGDLPLRNAAGVYVHLRQLADIYETTGRYQVLHRGARRVQTVTANVAGGDVVGFVAEARRRILSSVELPAGVYIEFAGTAEEQARSARDLLVHSLLAGVGIMLLLSFVTRSWRNVALILANLPFALIGGVLAAFALGGMLSLGSLVGFVTLFGITVRNSIMMVAHFEHLVDVEGMQWGPAAATKGAADRLTPILMTTLVTALGLLPLAIGMNAPGREIEGPMAVVILGGLLTSMVLNLLVLPTLALRFGRFEKATD